MATTSYDSIPYQGFPKKHTHPDLLASHARLFGLCAPDVQTANILELGCGDGANLLSIACSLPQSRCAGVDASIVQIGKGQQLLERAGMKNAVLVAGDLTKLAHPPTPYDYIMAHGVYSWIPPKSQDAMLSLIKDQLAPDGVAYISYNCYPGWNLRQMMREMMLYRTRGVKDPAERVKLARQLLPTLIQAVPSPLHGYAALLRDENQLLNQFEDYYIAHEHLEANNRPCYFHEFAEQLRAHGLQFLCEAELSSMYINRYPAALAHLQSSQADVIEAEQWLDYAMLRMFRQTLICHAEQPLFRQLSSKTVRNMRASALGIYAKTPERLEAKPETFQGAKGAQITTADPLCKAALMVMAERWPESLEFSEIESLARRKLEEMGTPSDTDGEALAELLLAGATAEVLELHTVRLPLTSKVSAQPIASPLARAQCEDGRIVSNLRQISVPLDPLSQRLLPRLDGTRTWDMLTAEAVEWVNQGQLVLNDPGSPDAVPLSQAHLIAQHVEARLRAFARQGLLMG